MSDYQVFLFGAPRVEFRSQQVSIDTRKALAMLAYLLVENKPMSRDTLAALLWPESNQTSARAALRRTLSTLRSVLPENLLDFGRELIALQPGGDLWCDVTEFHNHLNQCSQHGHADDQVCRNCLVPLQNAVELYTADFMVGFGLRDSVEFDDWQFFESDRLRRDFIGVLERLVRLHNEQNDYPVAIQYARRWLASDTINEAAHQALITLYALNGQRSAALRQYRECVRILDQELGVPPLEETNQLYEAVKENRVATVLSEESVQESDSQLILEKDSVLQKTPPTPLIGRAPEWKQITQIYEGLRQNGVFIALTGEPGIGKTRLADECITHWQSDGVITLSTRCYVGESNLAYAPLIDLLHQGLNQAIDQNWWQGLQPYWLSEVALLVPELSAVIPELPTAQPIEGPGAQTRFYEGICQILTALVRGPMTGVIFIDDLHWADESTLDLLAYLTRRLVGRPILLLATWQMEYTAGTAILDRLLNEIERQGYGFHLPLSALQPEQSLELIKKLENSDQPFSQDFKRQLVETSQGLPYFLVEYLQATLEGEIRSDTASTHWPIPTGLRGILHDRLINLSGPTTQILQAAAIIGRTFESDLLQSTSGRTEEEIVQGIEELLTRNLILELPDQAPNQLVARYDFKQQQLRALVLAEISLVRRRLLHRRTAEALVEQNRLVLQSNQSGQIAYHFQQAGLPERAAEYYFQAGQIERIMHANADALTHFQAALASGYPQKSDVLVEIGDLHTLNGDYLQAIQQYESAAAFSDPDLLATIEQKIGRIYLRRGFWEQAACHFEAALYNLEALPPERRKAFEAEVRADWSLSCHREGKTEQAYALARAALSLAEASDNPLALAQVHNLLGILSRAGEYPGPTAEHLHHSLEFARQLENPSAQIAALNNLALAQADQDDNKEAIATLEKALDVCHLLGDRHLEAALRNNLADVLRASGQSEDAMTQLKQAVTIFAEIGENVEDWEPEIWKLAEW